MKKLCILIVLLLISPSISARAQADIVFESIPWLSNETTVISMLKDKELIRDGCMPTFTNEHQLIICKNEVLGFQPAFFPEYTDECFSTTLSGMVKGRIASYPLKNLQLVFAYDGEYKLIAIKVELMGADFETLYNKLIKVYGNPSIWTMEDEGIISNIWQANNSAILLYTESNGLNYTLIYGRTDAEIILSQCLNSDPNNVSGL